MTPTPYMRQTTRRKLLRVLPAKLLQSIAEDVGVPNWHNYDKETLQAALLVGWTDRTKEKVLKHLETNL